MRLLIFHKSRPLFLTLFLCCGWLLALSGQEAGNLGWIALANGDTLTVEINTAGKVKLSQEVSFKRDNNNKTLLPDEVKAFYSPKVGYYKSTMFDPGLRRSVPNETTFVKFLLEGPQMVYRMIVPSRTAAGTTATEINTTAYLAIASEKTTYLKNTTDLEEDKRKYNCDFSRKRYQFNDYDVTQFYREVAACQGTPSKLMVPEGQRLGGIRFGGTVGLFNYSWQPIESVYNSSSFGASTRLQFSAIIEKPLNQKLDVVGGLGYTSYEPGGSAAQTADQRFANVGESFSGDHEVKLDYLTLSVGLQYRFSSTNSKFTPYLQGGLQIGALINEDISMYQIYLSDDDPEDPGVGFLRGRILRSPEEGNVTRFHSSIEGESLLAPYLGLGGQFEFNSLTLFLEARGQLGRTVSKGNYRFTELGVMAGVWF